MRRHPERRAAAAAIALLAATAALAQAPAPPPPAAPAPAPAAPATRAPPPVSTVTPVNERVLVIGALAKRTGQSRFFTIKPGQYVDFAGIRITARTCETTPPWETPALSGAFLQVDERLVGQAPRRVFSGWLYAQSPSLNVMEHPRYDVWLKSCTMRFPDGPKPRSPSASSAAQKSAEPATAGASMPR